MPETTTNVVHRSKFGTYHADPKADCAWTVNDTRGYIDGGPACDECGACECNTTRECAADGCEDCRAAVKSNRAEHGVTDAERREFLNEKSCANHENADTPCIGLAFAFICLDGGDSLCLDCADKAGIEVIECDCE